MLGNLKALIVILAMALIAFHYAKSVAPHFSSHKDFLNRKNTWILLTCFAFVSFNFWIYAVGLIIILALKQKTEKNIIALYFALIFLIPTGTAGISGGGLINHFISLSHHRALTIILLVPALLKLSNKNYNFSFGKVISDKVLVIYLVYISALFFRDTSASDGLRQSLYNLIDIFIPYYVISRYLKSLEQLRDALFSLFVALVIMSMIGIFEHFKGWLLYNELTGTLGINDGLTGYLGRAGGLRAVATSGHSISLGFAIMVAIGLYIYIQNHIPKKSTKRSGWLILAGGIYSSVSRGPWVGAVFLYIIFVLTGKQIFSKLAKLGAISVTSLALLSFTPAGSKLIDLLPYIGNVDTQNITYREHLYENSIAVIKRNPLTGSTNYLQAPELQASFNGAIIDIVNTYLGLTLSSGFIGVSLFLLFFISILFKTLRTLKRIQDKSSEIHLLGRVLFATMCSMLFVIVTTSPVGIIYGLLWMMAGLLTAYIGIVQNNQHLTKINDQPL